MQGDYGRPGKPPPPSSCHHEVGEEVLMFTQEKLQDGAHPRSVVGGSIGMFQLKPDVMVTFKPHIYYEHSTMKIVCSNRQ